MPVSRQELLRQRTVNFLRAALLLGGLASIVSVLGWLVAGLAGLVWALAVLVVVVLTGGRIPARLVLARSGARPLAPHQAPQLHQIVGEVAHRAALPSVPSLHYVPSPMLNAFAVGTRNEGGIAVTAGLLRHLNLREIAGVLAHEICHLRHNDTQVMALASLMTQLTLSLATIGQIVLLISLPWVLTQEHSGLWLLVLGIMVLPTLSTLVQLALSRNREFSADLEAAALTGDPEGLASALATLERHHGVWLESLFLPRGTRRDHPWLRTHPPTEERIRRLLATRLPLSERRRPVVEVMDPRFRRRGDLGSRSWGDEDRRTGR